jgi:proteasome lid subunit RPN8/RPN11
MSDLSSQSLVFHVPRQTVDQSLQFFKQQGERGHEGVALWPGKLVAEVCDIGPAVIPRQITGPRMYQIPADESFRIIKSTAKQNLVIPIQIHSHPASAYHSEADDEYAFLQHLNAISIVVPCFGHFDPDEFLEHAVFYRLRGPEQWKLMEVSEIERSFAFEGFHGLD